MGRFGDFPAVARLGIEAGKVGQGFRSDGEAGEFGTLPVGQRAVFGAVAALRGLFLALHHVDQQPVGTGAVAGDDGFAGALHGLGGAVQHALQRRLPQLGAGLVHRAIPGGPKRRRVRVPAQPPGRLRRHVDGARGSGDGAAIGEPLNELPLPMRRPAIVAGLHGDGVEGGFGEVGFFDHAWDGGMK